MENKKIPDDDWRRFNQNDYLKGVTLSYKKYKMPRPDWDHDHCEFCFETISEFEGDLNEAYTTLDDYYWICPQCFDDFKEEFVWIIYKPT
jgi:hypothetical protein